MNNRNKITIDVYSLIKDVIRNSWVIVLSALIAAMGTYIASHSIYKPEYTAKATLVVNNSGASINYNQMTNANEIAKVLCEVFSEAPMLERAAEHLGADSFRGSVNATVLSTTNFLELSVTSDSPKLAYDHLNAILKVYPQVTSKLFSNARMQLIRQATIPTAPSNSVPSENSELIISGAIAVALFIIVALSVMRDTVKTESDFKSKIDAKLIGCVLHEDKKMSLKDIAKKKKKGLLIHNNAFISLRFIEYFHKIAAKIEYMKHKDGSTVFAVTSVAENEGKSTCAANLAVSLADRGNRVVLIDLDAKKPALYKIFGEEYDEKSEFSNLMNKKIDASDFRLKKYKKSSLYLAINTKPCRDIHRWLESGEVNKVLEGFKKNADYIIIDTAPITVDSSVTDIIKSVDKSILVVRTDTVKVPAINDSISTINKISRNLAGCILNNVHQGIAPFSFSGNDEAGVYGSRHGKYGRYGKYGSYGGYGYYHQHRRNEKNDIAEE